MSKFILRIPNELGKKLTIVMTIFLIVDYAISGVVVFRWMEREFDIKANNVVAKAIDNLYPDEKMEKIYPNLVFKK